MISGKRERAGGRTERLLDLFTGGDEAEINECGDADTGDGVPMELVDQLEREGEEVEPNGAREGCKQSSLLKMSMTHCLMKARWSRDG